MAHCAEARRVRRELDKQLAATAAASGRTLVWTAQDREVLELIASAIDRKCDLQRDYAAAEEAKTLAKISAELRLTEASIARLLKQVSTDAPQPMSLRSLKAQRAARVRWDHDAG
jgi:short-subunit dehydrogenase